MTPMFYRKVDLGINQDDIQVLQQMVNDTNKMQFGVYPEQAKPIAPEDDTHHVFWLREFANSTYYYNSAVFKKIEHFLSSLEIDIKRSSQISKINGPLAIHKDVRPTVFSIVIEEKDKKYPTTFYDEDKTTILEKIWYDEKATIFNPRIWHGCLENTGSRYSFQVSIGIEWQEVIEKLGIE